MKLPGLGMGSVIHGACSNSFTQQNPEKVVMLFHTSSKTKVKFLMLFHISSKTKVKFYILVELCKLRAKLLNLYN